MILSREQLAELVNPALAEQWHEAIDRMLGAAAANTPLRAAHMLAQVLHESAGLTAVVENLNYSAEALRRTWPSRFPTDALARQYERRPEAIANFVYANRLGNGPPESGDGWRYRGRGLIQLTGRQHAENYQAASGSPVVEHPDLLAQPVDAALSAAWYWAQRGINRLADADDLEAVTRAVNGGVHGMQDRARWLSKAKAVLTRAVTAPATERLGEFQVLVLHGLSAEDLGAISTAAATSTPLVLRKPTVASRTGGKLDVRLLPLVVD